MRQNHDPGNQCAFGTGAKSRCHCGIRDASANDFEVAAGSRTRGRRRDLCFVCAGPVFQYGSRQNSQAKGVTTLILTGWKISGSVLYTSVGATLRDYTVVIPVDASLGPNDYEEVIGLYQILNQNSANPTNQPLKEKTSTLSRTDLITFQ